MDRRERLNDQEAALRAAMAGLQAGLWTACPGTVVKFTDGPPRVSVRLASQALVEKPDHKTEPVTISVLEDVPVVFPRGGGYSLTFPIVAGDEVLVVFASRSIDGWYQTGEPSRGPEPRFHDLSDGFAIPGPYSQPRKPSPVAQAGPQLRSDDGAVYVEVTKSLITLKAPAVRIEAAETTITGRLTVLGQIIGQQLVRGLSGIFGGVTVETHTHPENGDGGGTTSPPNR